jgi:hypothetical protein
MDGLGRPYSGASRDLALAGPYRRVAGVALDCCRLRSHASSNGHANSSGIGPLAPPNYSCQAQRALSNAVARKPTSGRTGKSSRTSRRGFGLSEPGNTHQPLASGLAVNSGGLRTVERRNTSAQTASKKPFPARRVRRCDVAGCWSSAYPKPTTDNFFKMRRCDCVPIVQVR